MKKFLLLTFIVIMCFIIIPTDVKADVAGLVSCSESSVFNKRLQNTVKKLELRKSKYEVNTPPFLALDQQIRKTQMRFENYSKAGLLCGNDGLPHLIADGRWSHARDFVFPGLLFLYITGWIGWVGRGYLLAVAETQKPTEKEIILDVPLAIKFMSSGFTWPLAAWQEFSSGNLLAPNDKITISPR
uniref:Photosystem I reaction center subunit III n=1 Tax=Hildenbrandia rivularis TaxID=135206 RepID=A0A1C9CFM1_9FLOR|nr:photosystem I subunit III [Hildenbrandia rivularis]AOM67169.1 photosystem I subunit III [Hildenbrandia rivularis]